MPQTCSPSESGGRAGAARGVRSSSACLVSTSSGELRLPCEAVRPCGTPLASRAAPRVEGDLLGRRARGADRPQAPSVRPGRSPPLIAFAETAGVAAEQPACRTSTCGTYLVDDLLTKTGPRSNGTFARGARSLPRRRRLRAGVGLADAVERCGGYERRSYCGAQRRRSSRTRSSTVASAGSPSRPRPGYADSSNRSHAKCSPPRPFAGRATSIPPLFGAAARRTQRGTGGLAPRQLWGLLSFTLWHEVSRRPRAPGSAARGANTGCGGCLMRVWIDMSASCSRPRLPASDRVFSATGVTTSRSPRASTRRPRSSSVCTVSPRR